MTSRLASLLAACLLSGCATFYANQSDVADQIDLWLQQDEYDKALNTIRAMDMTHPDYVVLSNSVPIIERKRARFIQTSLANAKAFEPNQDWVAAGNIIDSALEKLPESPELIAQAEFYEDQRKSRFLMDDAAITIAKAQYIISARPHQESKLYNSNNRFFGQQRFNEFLNEAQRTSRELYVIGQRYWQDQKTTQAREALTLSVQTAPNELSATLLEEILSQEKEQRSVARIQQQKQVSELFPELEQSFRERLLYRDYVGAQKILNEMFAFEIPQAEGLQTELNLEKQARVQQLIASGNTLYNSGYLQEAVVRWEQGLTLDPENPTLIQQLERASKFLNNLERWKNRP